MDSKLTITLANPAIRDALADCEVGHQKEITIIVTPTSKTNAELTATVNSVEYSEPVDSGDGDETIEESPMGQKVVPREVIAGGMKGSKY